MATTEGEDNEEWRDLVGWEGFYQVSSLGRFRGVTRRVEKFFPSLGVTRECVLKGRILKSWRKRNGYFFINPCRDGTPEHVYAHRAVCETFNGPPPSSAHQTAHLNGNRADNRAKNLVWVTPFENTSHKIGHGTLQQGSQIKTSVVTEDDVRRIRARIAAGETCRRIAEDYPIGPVTIWGIGAGRTWKHVR
jgi:hypothetical protein